VLFACVFVDLFDALPEALGQLPQLAGSEENEDNGQDENQFPSTQHSGSKKRIHRLFVSDGDTRPRAKRCKAPFRPPKPSETSESDEGIQTLLRSRWGKKDQFAPPVFLPGGFVMAGIERLFLTE